MPVTAEPPSRRRRRITRVFAAALLLLGIGSCTSILDVERYASVAEEMCTLLDRCYDKSENIGCREDIEGHLSGTSSEVRASWLESLTARSCLETCNAGRVCLDLEPLCTRAGACARRENCCGSLGGHADCNAGTCCKTRGSACKEDQDCCSDAGACDPVSHTCGGSVCTEAGEPCLDDLECCTRVCKDRSCATTICNDNKFECTDDKDCCSGFCDPRLSVCADRPICNEEGTDCAVETDCCAGTHCARAPGTLAGKCAATTCTLDLLDCSEDGHCCSGHCDSSFFVCSTACAYADHPCAEHTDCCTGLCEDHVCKGACSTGTCTKGEDCCSGSCVDGTCAAQCNPLVVHTTCTPGGPLAAVDLEKPCIEAICAKDPYCCCGAWDDVCVEAAVKLGQLCTDRCY